MAHHQKRKQAPECQGRNHAEINRRNGIRMVAEECPPRLQADGYEGELSPAQWMALRFFARANSFSRTPSAFAEFQATTRGTASQAIKALEAGGGLARA